ncbi:MAG: hypothetical protein E7398_01675 [Ruminococcaceae bacterium]|nr:hypothetical protein [Oscillospiraceae bacterium]
MNMKKIVDYGLDRIHIISRKRGVKKNNKHYFKMLSDSGIKIRRLSKEQKRQVDAIYKKYGLKYSYATHELVYSVTGEFNPEIVPEDAFRTQIEIYLNDYDSKYVLSDKSYFDVFMPKLKFPDTIVRNIEGNFYDSDYNVITFEKAKEIIDSYDEVVFKPSTESGFGRSVELVNTREKNPLEFSKKNYVIQKVIKQHKALSCLNESSVNVCRMETIFIDGEVHVITAALRIGGVGSFTDNNISNDGKGMIIIGVDENGKLRKRGYYSCGLSTTCNPAGIEFEGYTLPGYDKMIEIAKKGHQLYPRVRFVGWDFCVDEQGEVICMEYNIKGPGVLYYQYANGSLLGKHTQKVCEFAKNQKKKRSIFR